MQKILFQNFNITNHLVYADESHYKQTESDKNSLSTLKSMRLPDCESTDLSVE